MRGEKGRVTILFQITKENICHQCVLSMASPVLKKAFLGTDVRYSGDKSSVVILDGISRSTVLLFLKFIYTGESRERRRQMGTLPFSENNPLNALQP